MIEVEVKLKVDDLAAVCQVLADRGCVLSDPLTQTDYVYLPKDETARAKPDKPVLRVRETDKEVTMTLKRNISSELYCNEYELVIDDANAGRKLIEALDFAPYVTVKKKRQTGKLGDYTVCVDEVEGLGSFIELESITEQDDHADIEKKLVDYLAEIGIMGERVLTGYDTMLVSVAGNKGL